MANHTPPLANSGQKNREPASPPKQPVVLPPRDVILAAFTPRELDTLRSVCRDAENAQFALQTLNAGLARGGK